MKKFFSEFKKFITRGNVIDMAVGVIVGGAFTAIVNAVCNNVLKPIVNWLLALILGGESLNDVYTYLKIVTDEAGEIILKKSIFIDWGSLINAVIQFLLIAFVLFCIVKAINRVKEEAAAAKKKKLTREERVEMKAKGLVWYKKADVKAYREAKSAEKAAADAIAAKEAAEKAAADRAANPTSEDLLKEILATLKANEKSAEK